MTEHWDAEAERWARVARDPEWDHHFWRFNMPRFLELAPPPGRATLDVGCGEGRLGRLLVERGHRVTGIEASPTLATLARDGHEVVEADAADLPFPDGSFDLAVAFMSLINMERLDRAVAEVARVLEPGGRFCIAVVHPIRSTGEFDDGVFRATRTYFDRHDLVYDVERDGTTFTFHDVHRPLEAYSRALENAGLLIEAIREPVPDPPHIADRPRMERWLRVPLFLHLRARKP